MSAGSALLLWRLCSPQSSGSPQLLLRRMQRLASHVLLMPQGFQVCQESPCQGYLQ